MKYIWKESLLCVYYLLRNAEFPLVPGTPTHDYDWLKKVPCETCLYSNWPNSLPLPRLPASRRSFVIKPFK